ncbi:putative leader peptide [Streptomyces sp. ODS05-4]|nr:putative leader peptide [Streptomyces sp. ODS05-4]
MDRTAPDPRSGVPAARSLPLLTSRRHIDLLRVCSAAGPRRPATA